MRFFPTAVGRGEFFCFTPGANRVQSRPLESTPDDNSSPAASCLCAFSHDWRANDAAGDFLGIFIMHEAAAMLDALYSKCDTRHGALVIVSACKRRIIKAFPLGSSRLLVEAAKVMTDHPGSYYKVNPMDYGAIQQRTGETKRHVVGNQSEVNSIVSIHADVDADKPGYLSRSAALWAIGNMPVKPTITINSGSGGFHIYYLLRDPWLIRSEEQRAKWAALSKAWQAKLREMCGGMLDSTANLDRILRCVGSTRDDGRQVTCESCDFSRLYEMKDFN